MYQKYLLTGATTQLGKHIMALLLESGHAVRVLVHPDDETEFDPRVEVFQGQSFDKESMKKFFDVEEPKKCALIHAEEVVEISERINLAMRRVNVTGAQNVADCCLKSKIGRMVYIGTAYSLDPRQAQTSGSIHFDSKKVSGEYAKTKAEAGAYIMNLVTVNKYDAVFVLPTFIIGPDTSPSSDVYKALDAYMNRAVPPVEGGHSFVDVRDVALSTLAIANEGEKGCGYFVTGNHKNSIEFFHEACAVSGVNKEVKQMARWAQSAKFAKLVDTFYKISKKDNPKEVYSLFRNMPDADYQNTAYELMPNAEVTDLRETLKETVTSLKIQG
ncbi:MAG: NAD-dependent epimerase/dehydratase family protein [Clostridia bacterium]|nr:NAD-dependent epimerase/dehydratase family protein [Clostridia bacterium]